MTFTLQTSGHTDIIDITDRVSSIVAKRKIKEGIACIFVKGSTAAITTIEKDSNLYHDLREVLEKIIPMKENWKHHNTWGDDNGGAHLRASIIGPSITLPVIDSRLILGSWQQIVLIDFDTSPRQREISVVVSAS